MKPNFLIPLCFAAVSGWAFATTITYEFNLDQEIQNATIVG